MSLPLPYVLATLRTRAPCFPQTSQIICLPVTIAYYGTYTVMITNLPVGLNLAITSISPAVFPLSSDFVFLTLQNLSSQNTAFNIKDRQRIIIHLLFPMDRHNIFTVADLIPHLFQNSLKHLYSQFYCLFSCTIFADNVGYRNWSVANPVVK